MGVEHFETIIDSVNLRNIADAIINPATEEKQDTQITRLDSILSAVDGLEVSVGDVDVNTDQLEAKIDSTNSKLDSILTEITEKTEPVDQQHVIIDTIPEVEIKNDSNNPIPVSSTDLDIRNLVFASDKVDTSGSSIGVSSISRSEDINNTVNGVVLPAYLGVPYSPNVGGAPGAVLGDMWAGTWTDFQNYSGFTTTPFFPALGQGYAEFSNDNGATINHYETTIFGGGGSFTNPRVAKYFRLLFQNRSAASTTFKTKTILDTVSVNPFIFPIAAPIDGSLPASLTRTVITGQQPDQDYENVRVAGSDPGNSTSILLGSGATFTGIGFDATGFVSILIIVNSSHSSATNGLKIQFSNNEFINITKEHVFTYSSTDVGKGRSYSVPANQGEKYRVVFINGSTNQTFFDLRAELSTGIIQPMTDDIGRGSILVSPGLRISQVLKRNRQEVNVIAQTISASLFTVPVNKKYYVTSIIIAAENNNTTTAATGRLRDGSISGTLKYPFKIKESTGGLGGINEVQNVSQTFDEPIEFSTSVFYEEAAGDITADIVLIGYLEDS